MIVKDQEIMTLFDDIHRPDDGPALYAEPGFSYLNRSARPIAMAIRQLLESWFAQYSATEQNSLRNRFRSPIDSQHLSAFFELYLYQLFRHLDCEVDLHPNVKDQEKHPDFVVKPINEQAFYMEAILATDETKENTAARARINTVYDALNRVLDSPNFFIGVDVRGAPKSQPPAKKIATFLEERLRTINPDQLTELLKKEGSFDVLPHWQYSHDGWEIAFFPIPKSLQSRGKPGVRPMGLQIPEVQWVDPRAAVRDAIIKKAGRYGNLDLPYVVAVNALGFANQSDIMEALFGKETLQVTFTESEPRTVVDTRLTRALDGAWTSKSGPRYTRVSAVLIAYRLTPWSLPSATVHLFHNPWAQRPLSLEQVRLTQMVPEDGKVKVLEGETAQAILGLPSAWPTE